MDPRDRPAVRAAIPNDIPEMQRIRAAVRENRLSDPSRVARRDYERLLAAGGAWVCDVQGSVAGFAVADRESESIWALFVDPAHERRGIGRALHDVMVEWLFACGAASITLTTDPHTRAERFYRAAGWMKAGMEPNGEVRFTLTAARRHAG